MNSYLKTRDYFNTQEEFELLHDTELDMLVTKPQPKNLLSYYENEAYISHSDGKKSFIDHIYHLVKKYSNHWKLKFIRRYSDQNKLLDIGAGTGDFLVVAQQNKWSVTGVEPNAKAKHKALEKGISLHNEIKDLKGEVFDVITLWHVLEHLPDLDEQITQILNLLKKDGILIIAVPNFKSHDAQKYGKHWAAYDVPRHLWHFSKNSIKKIFEKKNTKLIDTKPMFFDAYYVSLLSEKYKTGRTNYLKAFYTGFVSNFKALSSKEYSSLVFVLKKD